MTRLDIEHRQGFPWWIVLAAILALLLIALLWYYLAAPRAELADEDRTQVTTGTDADAQLDLDTVITETGLPREFAYGGLTWRAVDTGRYEADGLDLIAIGPRISGNELYYEQGTPTNPYETLYLRGTTENYRNVFVRYEPVEQ